MKASRYAKILRKAARKDAQNKKYNIIPLPTSKPTALRWKQHRPAQGWYERYLKSEWWLKRREKAKADAGYKCNRCGSRSDLEVHHRNYNSLNRERRIDLEVLCNICHKKHHSGKIAPPQPRSAGHKANPKSRSHVAETPEAKERRHKKQAKKNGFVCSPSEIHVYTDWPACTKKAEE